MLNIIGISMIFLSLGMPVAFAVGISGFIFFLMRPEIPWTILVQKSLSTTQSFTILAIPLFASVGNLMGNTGITSRLMKLANVLTGYMYGSIDWVSVVLPTLMGGVLESAVANAAMECRVLGLEVIKYGHVPGWSVTINCLSRLVAATILPSMGLILYGTVGEVFIGCLFIAGFVPGPIMCIFMMVAIPWSARHFGYKPDHEKPSSPRETGKTCTESIWALLFPIILIVLIRGGVMTPSESGTFTVFYALAMGVLAYRELTWEEFKEYLIGSVKDISVIAMVLVFSGVFSHGVVYDQLPRDIASFLVGMTSDPIVMLFLVIVMLIVCSMFMETTIITLTIIPILLPAIRQHDVDLIQFGIIVMTTVTMGCSTPPVGVVLYTCSSTMGCPMEETTKCPWPLFVAILGTLLIYILLPGLILFLPNLVYGPST